MTRDEEQGAYGLLQRGHALLRNGHHYQAVVVLDRAARVEPEKTSIREALARALYNSGQTRRAGEEFARVVELDPSNDYAHFGLALCEARLGRRQKAIGHLKMAVAMRPDAEAYRTALTRLAG